MEQDLFNNVSDNKALNTVQIASDTKTVGIVVDTKGFESMIFSVYSGVITDGSYIVVIEEGNDLILSDATVLPDENRLGTLPLFSVGTQNAIRRVGSIGKKRYQRVSIVSTGVTTGGTFTAIAILGHPRTAKTYEPLI